MISHSIPSEAPRAESWEIWRTFILSDVLRFRGRALNRVDGKGRVSVPAKFRAVLESEGREGVVCVKSLNHEALDAGGRVMEERNQALLDELGPYTEEREAFGLAFMGVSEELRFDGDGRITLPDGLRDYAGIGGEAVFVGIGERFWIWEPGRLAKYENEAMALARERASRLPALGKGERGLWR